VILEPDVESVRGEGFARAFEKRRHLNIDEDHPGHFDTYSGFRADSGYRELPHRRGMLIAAYYP